MAADPNAVLAAATTQFNAKDYAGALSGFLEVLSLLPEDGTIL
jgi:hypothetical protein